MGETVWKGRSGRNQREPGISTYKAAMLLEKKWGNWEKRLVSWGRQQIWFSILECESAQPWEMAGLRQAMRSRCHHPLLIGYSLIKPSLHLLCSRPCAEHQVRQRRIQLWPCLLGAHSLAEETDCK